MADFRKWLRIVLTEEFRVKSLFLWFSSPELFAESPVSLYSRLKTDNCMQLESEIDFNYIREVSGLFSVDTTII